MEPFERNNRRNFTSRCDRQAPLDLLPFLATEGFYKYFTNAPSGQPGQTDDYQYLITNTNKSGWAKNSTSPLKSADMKIVGLLCTIDEITLRKQNEEKIKINLALLQSINDQLSSVN